jgi:hypothetical protein
MICVAEVMADIQVNLHKGDRELQSHDIKDVRPQVQKIAKKYGANVKLSKFHRTSVLSTLVAEVYGPRAKLKWRNK